MNEYYVYFLINSLDNAIFYVGKGKLDRMYKHEKLADRGIVSNNNPVLYNKILKIKRLGGYIIYQKPFINITNEESLELEKLKISEIGLKNLCNLHPGGQGGDHPECHTPEAMEKRASKLRGRKLSDKQKKQISDYWKNNPRQFSKEDRELLRRRFTGKGNPMFGKTHPQRIREIISKANKGKIMSQETREKISRSIRGRIRTPEHCKNLSIAKTKAYQKLRLENKIPSMTEEARRKSSIAKLGGIITFIKNGEKFNPINISKFYKENGLSQRQMIKLQKGIIREYKGWTIAFEPVLN
jgi:hypothetical protein